MTAFLPSLHFLSPRFSGTYFLGQFARFFLVVPSKKERGERGGGKERRALNHLFLPTHYKVYPRNEEEASSNVAHTQSQNTFKEGKKRWYGGSLKEMSFSFASRGFYTGTGWPESGNFLSIFSRLKVGVFFQTFFL